VVSGRVWLAGGRVSARPGCRPPSANGDAPRSNPRFGKLAPALRDAVRAIDPEQPIGTIQTMEEMIFESMIGVVIGVAAARALTRYVESLLYGITPNDPATFASAPLLLAAVALVAFWVPARRAAAVDPIIALWRE